MDKGLERRDRSNREFYIASENSARELARRMAPFKLWYFWIGRIRVVAGRGLLGISVRWSQFHTLRERSFPVEDIPACRAYGIRRQPGMSTLRC